MKIYPIHIENEEFWKDVKKKCLDVGLTPRGIIMELLRLWVEGKFNLKISEGKRMVHFEKEGEIDEIPFSQKEQIETVAQKRSSRMIRSEKEKKGFGE